MFELTTALGVLVISLSVSVWRLQREVMLLRREVTRLASDLRLPQSDRYLLKKRHPEVLASIQRMAETMTDSSYDATASGRSKLCFVRGGNGKET